MAGATTKYVDAGFDVVQELNGSGQVTANLLTGIGIDEVFRRTETAGSVRDLLTDRLGGTIALADTTGAVQTSYTYEPFGKTTVSGSSSTNGFQFTGRENDGATNLYFYRARYYSPSFHRFISEDPIGFSSGDVNLYAYVGDNPANSVDSLGLERNEDDCGVFGWRCGWDWIKENPKRFFGDVFNCVLTGWEFAVAGSVIPGWGTVAGAVIGCGQGVWANEVLSNYS